MTSILILERYEVMCRSLIKAEEKLQQIQNSQFVDKYQNQNALSVFNPNTAQDKETIMRQIRRVEQFSDLASGAYFKEGGEPRPFNEDKLIEYSSMYGTEVFPMVENLLYTEIDGQLKYLRAQLVELEKKEEDDKRQREDEERRKQQRITEFEESKSSLISQLKERTTQYLYSEGNKLASQINAVKKSLNLAKTVNSSGLLPIGDALLPFPILPWLRTEYSAVFGNTVDLSNNTIRLPVAIPILNGHTYIIKYDVCEEEKAIQSAEQIICSVAACFQQKSKKRFDSTLFIDPLRYNGSMLGELEDLFDGRSIFHSVPRSKDDIRRTINMLLNSQRKHHQITDQKENQKNRIVVLHDYPHGYDAPSIELIQQMCLNAEQYGIVVILLYRNEEKGTSNKIASVIESKATVIGLHEYTDNLHMYSFQGYLSDGNIPPAVFQAYIDNQKKNDAFDNGYEDRIGFDVKRMKKGCRSIPPIPVGVDEDGKIHYLDFENNHFAGFVCGASRSGKTVLLHTIINGLLKNTNPDDIEIWLTDYKMIEFTRYTNPVPPQVKYIMLDKAPELAYDIIDSLYEKMTERQEAFSGIATKLSEIPQDEYMPAVFVIIDEYTVMSKIIGDAHLKGRGGYDETLKIILRNSAALGFYFIFASQVFNNATNGLELKQVQQRIALSGDYLEIKNTLDVRSPSAQDEELMRTLEPHYCLVSSKTPDENGNYVKKLHVLYINEPTKQMKMVQNLLETYSGTEYFFPADDNKYLEKQAVVLQSNKLITFDARKSIISEYIESKKDELEPGDIFLFIGQPLRMKELYPILIINEFCSNIMIVSSLTEKMPTCSIICSIQKSCLMQNYTVEYWGPKRDPVYKGMINSNEIPRHINCYSEIEEICKKIHYYSENIKNRIPGNSFIFIFGYTELQTQIEFAMKAQESMGQSTGQNELQRFGSMQFSKREDGEDDLITKLNKLRAGEISESQHSPDEKNKLKNTETNSSIIPPRLSNHNNTLFNAIKELQNIIAFGPSLGYHFVVHFATINELSRSKVDLSAFKIKLMSKAPSADVRMLIPTEVDTIPELQDHHFRYSDGLNATTFRPFLYPQITWDRWVVDETGDAIIKKTDIVRR